MIKSMLREKVLRIFLGMLVWKFRTQHFILFIVDHVMDGLFLEVITLMVEEVDDTVIRYPIFR